MSSIKKQLARGLNRLGLAKRDRHRDAGDAARDRRDWFTASEHYRRHLQGHPQDFGIWVQLGHALREAALWTDAEAAYSFAAEGRPEDADLMLHRGHLARRAGDVVRAEEFYRLSFALDGNVAARSEFRNPDLVQPGALGQVGSIDAFDDGLLTGWAADETNAGGGVEIEIMKDDVVIARARTAFRRADVEAAGLASGLCGFRIDLLNDVSEGDVIWARTGHGHVALSPGPVTVRLNSPTDAWLRRHESLSPEQAETLRADCTRDAEGQMLSFIVATGDAPATDVRRLLSDLRAQWCSNWEAVWIVDRSCREAVRNKLEGVANKDPRVRLVQIEDPVGASDAWNIGLSQTSGDTVALIEPAQGLEPEAVHRLLDARRAGAGLVYADEASFHRNRDQIESFDLKPAFGLRYFLSAPYFLRFFCVAADLASQIPPLNPDLPPLAARLSLVLEILDKCRAVAHVPAVLSRHRRSSQDLAAAQSQLGVLSDHLKRRGSEGRTVIGPGQTFVTEYPPCQASVLIVIPTKDRIDLLRTCLESIWTTCEGTAYEIVVIDHESREPESVAYLASIAQRVTLMPYAGEFNFARMNNQAFHRHGGPHELVLFLNNDIEAISPGWLQRMAALAVQPDVGVVGANLLYSDRRVQHSGVIVGLSGAADHAHRFARHDAPDSISIAQGLLATREYSAVTAACMIMRSELFRRVGGYDEALAIGFNDTDLCLRVAAAGFSNLNDGATTLYHHESATRTTSGSIEHPRDADLFISRWRKIISLGDPFYSPLMSTSRTHRPSNVTATHHPARLRPGPSRPVRPPIRTPRRIGAPVDVLTSCERPGTAQD